MKDEQKTGQRIKTCKTCKRRAVWSSRLGKWIHVAPQESARMHGAKV